MIRSFVFIFLFIIAKCSAVVPSWEWAYSPVGCYLEHVCSDKNGNAIFCGGVSNGAIIGNDTIHSNGIITIKYDATGNIIWKKVEAGRIYTSCVTVDRFNNIYVGGSFMADSATGLIVIGIDTLFNSGSAQHNQNCFLIKYDENGINQWARCANGTNIYSVAVATDYNGNIYATGGFTNDTVAFGSNTLVNSGYYDYYVVKYDLSGNVLWARDGGGLYYDEVHALVVDSIGDVYVGGLFYGLSTSVDNFIVMNQGQPAGTDGFLVKFDPNGNALWIKSIGAGGNEEVYAMSIDRSGNIYVGGAFDGGGLAIGTYILTEVGSGCGDLYLAKYDSNGNVLWARSTGGDNCDMIFNLTCDSIGNVYASGTMESSQVIFDSDTLGTIYGSQFITKFNTNGNCVWAKQVGTNCFVSYNVNSLSSDALGNIFFTCDFQGCTSINLDSIVIANNNGTSVSGLYGKIKSGIILGVSTLFESKTVSIYPNPTNSIAIIDFADHQIDTQIELIDISGKIISKFSFDGFRHQLDCSKIESGVYLVKIKNLTNNFTYVTKLIVD